MRHVPCDYCQRPAEFVSGRVIYPHRPDLAHEKFWRCEPCGAWVGCHRRNKRLQLNGDEPKGRLANAELRKIRMRAHDVFDSLWRSGGMERTAAYEWLAGALGISVANCHIGMLDVGGCKAVINAVAARRRTA